jgi:hypothetical protein
MNRTLNQITIRQAMIAVAILAVFMGIAAECWRRYQLAEVARKFPLGELKITGSSRVVRQAPPTSNPTDPGSLDPE